MTNTEPVERIFEDDTRVPSQTLAHHKARYQFACQIQTPIGNSLDIACGTGYGTEILRHSGYKAVGIDIDKASIEFAKIKYPLCTFRQTDITDCLPLFPPNDLITLFEAIEHITLPHGISLLQRIKLILKDNGVFLLSVPRDENPIYNKFHKSHWSYETLRRVLKEIFSSVKIYGQDWDTAKINSKKVKDNDFYIAVCKNDKA